MTMKINHKGGMNQIQDHNEYALHMKELQITWLEVEVTMFEMLTFIYEDTDLHLQYSYLPYRTFSYLAQNIYFPL